MNYSDNPRHVRVDFWKESGNWYTTEMVEWRGYHGLIHEEFAESLRQHFGGKERLSDMRATCLEPYNEHGHPISIKVSSIWPAPEKVSDE